MQRVKASDRALALPAYSDSETPGYFDDQNGGPGTLITASFLNQVQEELLYIVETIGGLTADHTSNTQLGTVLGHIRGILTDVAATGSVTTGHTRAVIAGGGTVSGDASAAIACSSGGAAGVVVTAPESAAIASQDVEVRATFSAVIASDGSNIPATASNANFIAGCNGGSGVEVVADGAQVAILACVSSTNSTVTGEGQQILIAASTGCSTDANADRSAIIASEGDTVDSQVDIDAAQSAIIACGDALGGGMLITGDNSFAAASGGRTAGAGSTIAAHYSAIIASDDCDALRNTNAALLAAIASNDSSVGHATSDGERCVVIAANLSSAYNGSGNAVIACTNANSQGAECAIVASTHGNVASTAQDSAIIGCEGTTGFTVDSDRTVVVGSNFAGWAGTITEPDSLVGGNSSGVQWTITGAGAASFQSLDVNDNDTTVSGTTCTLAGDGATGITNPAQDGWIRISINGTDAWVPYWQ